MNIIFNSLFISAYEAIGNIAEALNDITAVCIIEQFDNQSNLLMTDRLLRQQSKLKAKAFVKTRTPCMPSKHFMRHYFMSYVSDPIVKDTNVDEETPLISSRLSHVGRSQLSK